MGKHEALLRARGRLRGDPGHHALLRDLAVPNRRFERVLGRPGRLHLRPQRHGHVLAGGRIHAVVRGDVLALHVRAEPIADLLIVSFQKPETAALQLFMHNEILTDRPPFFPSIFFCARVIILLFGCFQSVALAMFIPGCTRHVSGPDY